MKYDDLEFIPHPHLDGAEWAELELPNGYTVSVVNAENAMYNFFMGRRYEVLAYRKGSDDIQTRFDNDAEVEAWINEIVALPHKDAATSSKRDEVEGA